MRIIIAIITVLFLLEVLFTYLIIKGESMQKIEQEKLAEDVEQIQYLNKYKNRRKKKSGK